jgi:uncharacterized protein YaiL (DUF2058 family)
MTHDLPPHWIDLDRHPMRTKDFMDYVESYAIAAIAPYKAEIERHSRNSDLQMERAIKAEAENANLRELLAEARIHVADAELDGNEPFGLLERIDAALKGKP